MHTLVRPAAVLPFFLAGCATIVGADFDGYQSSERRPGPIPDDPTAPAGEADGGASTSSSSSSSSTSSSGGSSGGSSSGASSSSSSSTSSGAPPRTCQGTATACEAIPYNQPSVCNAQAGCGATAGTCTNADACAAAKTNTACQQTPGCATDFTTSTCKPVAGHCTGTTKATCEAKAGCRLFGGCSGNAAACDQLTGEAACLAQSGCAFR